MLLQANQNFPRSDIQKCPEKLQYLYKNNSTENGDKIFQG